MSDANSFDIIVDKNLKIHAYLFFAFSFNKIKKNIEL